MKYKLLKQIDEKLSPTEQVLSNRGIEIGEIEHYLHLSKKDVSEPEALGEEALRHAAALVISVVKNRKNTVVIVDCDADGYTSSAVFINYMYTLFPTYVQNNLIYFLHDSKQHGLSDCTDWILTHDNVDLVVCPDSASNDYTYHRQLKENGIDVVVLDHHEADHISEDAVIINNQLCDYPNKALSGVGVTWQFCRYLDKLLGVQYANKFLDLVALGLDADMMSLLSYETKYLIQAGFEHPKNPFIVTMARKNDFSLKGRLTPIGVAFYIAPFVNAMTRSGTIAEKKLLFESMLQHKAFETLPSTKRGHYLGETETLVEQAVRVATNVKNRQQKAQDEGMMRIERMIEENNLLSHKVLLFLLKPGEVDRNIAGLIANKIMAKYQRPVCILTLSYEDLDVPPWEETPTAAASETYSGSARGCSIVGVTDFKQICLNTGLCNFAEGHPNAFGLSLNKENVSLFIQRTDEMLKDMTDEPIYYVDYILSPNSPKEDIIYSIAKLEDLWGQDMPEPYIAIEGLKVSPDKVVIYDKKGYTIKINGPVPFLKFKATERDCEKLQYNNTGYVEINLVGRCSLNEWNGNVTPQIFIEEYEIVDSNKYYF